MTYDELCGYVQRAVGASPSTNLLECMALLLAHTSFNRAIAAETIARFLAEFVEQDRRLPPAKPH